MTFAISAAAMIVGLLLAIRKPGQGEFRHVAGMMILIFGLAICMALTAVPSP